jgi:hypothetical protein
MHRLYVRGLNSLIWSSTILRHFSLFYLIELVDHNEEVRLLVALISEEALCRLRRVIIRGNNEDDNVNFFLPGKQCHGLRLSRLRRGASIREMLLSWPLLLLLRTRDERERTLP